MSNHAGGSGRLESLVNNLVEIVVTGNGEPSLREQVRTLRRDMEEVLEMKATLKVLEDAAKTQAGREDEKKTQIDTRQRKEGRRDFLITTIIALMGLFLVYSQYRSEQTRARFLEQLDRLTPQVAAPVAR